MIDDPDVILPQYMAYVEWFSPFRRQPEPVHYLYQVKRPTIPEASIIPITDIVRSAHLIPRFGAKADTTWSSSTSLHQCNTFFLNQFSDRNAYLSFV